jgi:hypothetical protein
VQLKDFLELAQAVFESRVTLLVVLLVAIWWQNRKIDECEKKHARCENRLTRALRIVVKLTTADQVHDPHGRRHDERREQDITRHAILSQVHAEADSLLREIEREEADALARQEAHAA